MPRALGRTSTSTGAPNVAVAVQTGLAIVVVAVFALLGADPYTQLLLWTNGPGILGVMMLSLPVVFAVGIGLALRLRRTDPSQYAHLTTFDLERG